MSDNKGNSKHRLLLYNINLDKEINLQLKAWIHPRYLKSTKYHTFVFFTKRASGAFSIVMHFRRCNIGCLFIGCCSNLAMIFWLCSIFIQDPFKRLHLLEIFQNNVVDSESDYEQE